MAKQLWPAAAGLAAIMGLLAGFGSRSEGAGELEVLWEVRNTPWALYVRVASNGCTEERDFDVNIAESRNDARQKMIRIVRRKPDNCKKREPQGKVLQFDKAKLGVDPLALFTVLNPFGSSPLFGSEDGDESQRGRRR